MSTPMPQRIKIGSLVYSIVFDQAVVNEHSVRSSANYAGYSDAAGQIIAVAETDSSGKPLGADFLRDTLLHEVLHCCLRASSCDPDDDAKADLPDVEERAVAAMSGPLLGVLRDNPALVSYLMDGAP